MTHRKCPDCQAVIRTEIVHYKNRLTTVDFCDNMNCTNNAWIDYCRAHQLEPKRENYNPQKFTEWANERLEPVKEQTRLF